MRCVFYINSSYEALFFLPLAKRISRKMKVVSLFVGVDSWELKDVYKRYDLNPVLIKYPHEIVLNIQRGDMVFYRFPYSTLELVKGYLPSLKLVRCVYGYSKYTGIPRGSYTFSPVVNEMADVVLVTGRYPFLKMSLIKKAVNAGSFYLDLPWRDGRWYPVVKKPRNLVFMPTWDEFKSHMDKILERLSSLEGMKVFVKLHPMDYNEENIKKVKNHGFRVVSNRLPPWTLYKMGDVFICDDTGAKFESLLFGKPTLVLTNRPFLKGSLERLFLEEGFLVPITLDDLKKKRISELVTFWGGNAWNKLGIFREFMNEIYQIPMSNGDIIEDIKREDRYTGPWNSPLFEKLCSEEKLLVLYYEVEGRWTRFSMRSLVVHGLPFKVDVLPVGRLSYSFSDFVSSRIVGREALERLDDYMGVGFFFNISVLPDGWVWSVKEFLEKRKGYLGFSPLKSLFVVGRKTFRDISQRVNVFDTGGVISLLNSMSDGLPFFFGRSQEELYSWRAA